MVGSGVLLGLVLLAAPAANCGQFNDVIDSTLKAAAARAAANVGKDVSGSDTAAWLSIQVNLQLMEAAGCALPKEPIHLRTYMLPALKCSTARLQQQSAQIRSGSREELPTPSECDWSKWQRQPFEVQKPDAPSQ